MYYSRFHQAFTRSSSELYSEIDKWAGNFVITFRSSEAISEHRLEIRKFKLCIYQETSKMSEKKTDDELLNWMDFFRNYLDVGESTVVYKTLKENKFRTQMQIALHFICIRVLNISFNVFVNNGRLSYI